MKIIDLHIHTNKSDGVLTPKQVIDEAYNKGLYAISISDHDTIDAYTEEIINYAKEKNIILIPAVEISTKTNKCGIHVLGYNFDINDTNFKNRLNLLRNSRHDYLHNVATKLKELGYIINLEELDKIDSVTKAHISLDVISNPLNNDILLKNFGHIPNKGEFIENIMNEGCPAYVKKATITPKEASQLIKSAKGKVVLAHPVAYKYEDGLTEMDIQEIIDDMELDGIETNYIYVDKHNEIIDETEFWNEFGIKNNLICTIGTDFHNIDGVHPFIGDIKLDEEEVEKIVEFLQKKI